LTNIHSEFEGHTDYVKGDDRRRWDKEFGIRHYAGTVIYTVNGFVDKNRDSQQDVFFDALAKSKSNFIQELCQFKDLLSRVAQLGEVMNRSEGSLSKGSIKRMLTNKAKPTVSDAFRLQLQVLVEVLQSTNPWYVRCIKPNMTKSGNDYDSKLVLDQLIYLGMLEIIRIRKQGFPIHYPYDEFMSRYRCFTKYRRLPSDAKQASK
jgi:myosin heavy subunit